LHPGKDQHRAVEAKTITVGTRNVSVVAVRRHSGPRKVSFFGSLGRCAESGAMPLQPGHGRSHPDTDWGVPLVIAVGATIRTEGLIPEIEQLLSAVPPRQTC
jgi:hypothetical protein